MSKTHVVVTCCHATPGVSNERFDWLGALLYDIKPEVFVNLGDFFDMKSLNTYDTRYPQMIVSQSYQADIEVGLDAQERLWAKFKRNKKGMPYRIGIAGNHEYRLNKAIAHDPRLDGDKFGISLSHYQTDQCYDEYYDYVNSAPARVVLDGVCYSHYIGAGNYGNAISGKRHAYALVEHMAHSVTVGHSHKLDYYVKANALPSAVHGLVAGNFKGAPEKWAGHANYEWRSGVVVKRYVENGDYDLQWISLNALQKEYGQG